MITVENKVIDLVTDKAESKSDGILVSSLSHFELSSWNERLLQSAGGSWRQSTYYGGYKKEFWGESPVYLVAQENGRILGQLLVLFTHPYGWSLHRYGVLPLSSVLKNILPWFYCLEGPVVFDRDRFNDVHEALYRWVLNEAVRRGCIGGSLIPSFYDPTYQNEQFNLRKLIHQIGFKVNEKATLIVNLNSSEDELFARLKKEARNKVRKSEKQGIVVSKLGNTASDTSLMLRAMRETACRNKVAPITQNMFEKSSWKRLYDEGLSHAFISKSSDGHLLSSQQLVQFNRIISLGGVSYTDFSKESCLYGNDLVQWKIIKWGLETGLRSIDFMGIAPNTNSEKMKSIYAFKAKWGGDRINYDEYFWQNNNVNAQLFRYLNDKLFSHVKKMVRSF